MKTTVIGSGKTTDATDKANNVVNKGADNKAATAPLKPNTAFDSGKAETAKPETPKVASKSVGAVIAVKPEALTAKPDAPKAAEQQQPKPALNLESTLKLVEELHRRKRQRDRLMETIENLESFEIEQQEEAEETNGNYYQGCKLVIEDDDRNQFVTKNPFIIQAVAQFVTRMCTDRMAEIEAGIVIPA